jgi:hypothetical protein
VNEGLDARTWLTLVGVIVGFFLAPFAMLEYDRRRAMRAGKTDRGGAALTGPEPEPVESPTTRGRDADMTRTATGNAEDGPSVMVVSHLRRAPAPPRETRVNMTVSTTSPVEPPLRASSFAAVRAQVVTIPGRAPKPTRSPGRDSRPTDQGSRP